MKRLHTQTLTLRARMLMGAAPIMTPIVALAATAAFATASIAQDDAAADEADRDVIIVTGFRGSLNAALNIKRDETGVVDAIVAEDIADFPDLNLAESLQRIPGISITRVNGEGRQITVRGLDGRFTRVRVNGMEALSTTGGSDASGGSNRGRSFDFNTFASDLFNEVRIRKTQSAAIEEGSLGANVELFTGQPFDYGEGFTAAASGQMAYNDLSEEWSPRAAGLASFTNPDETFGVLASIAYSDRTILEEGFSTVRFDDLGTFGSVGGDACVDPLPAACDTLRNSYYARIPRYGRLTHNQERLGLTGSVQFKPTPATVVSLDALYSDFDAERDEEFLEVFIRSNTGAIDVTDFTVDGDGVLTRLVGDLNPAGGGIIPARSEHRFDHLQTEFTQFTARVEHEFSDRLRGDVLLGTSESTNDNPIQATIFFDAAAPVTGYTYDFTQSLTTPSIDFGSMDVTDPSSFLFTQYRNRPQKTTNGFDTAQGNLAFDLNEAFTVSGGLSWKQYDFDTREVRTDGNVADLPGFSAAVPVTDAISGLLTGFGSGLGGAGYDTSWVSADFNAAADLIGLLEIPGDVRLQDTRAVKEEDLGGYALLAFDTAWGAMPVRGDVGVRYVETTTTATGYVNDQVVTVERSYEDTLPALNLVLEPHEDFFIRGGAAKVMARPTLSNLTPGGSIGTFSGPPFVYSLGNPDLDPFRATAYDVSFEWYFQEEALLSLGLFFKDVDSYFTDAQEIETTFSQTGLPASVAGSDSPLGLLLADGQDPAVEIQQQTNGGSAELKGFEIVYQQPFSFLPAPYDNFGFVGNFTHVESDEIINFSPNSYNATLYYEDDRFAARLVASQRDAYLTRRPDDGGRTDGREERGVAETFNLDASASWTVNDNVEVTFEAINLTDEFEHQTFDMLLLPTVYHHTGTEYLFGVRWRR